MTKKTINDMHKSSVNYCMRCIHPLESYGEIALATFMTICEHYAMKKHALPVDEDDCARGTFEILKFLEIKNYITTTEITKRACMVKPNFHSYSHKNGHLYCRDPVKHCPEFHESKNE